MSYKTEPGVCVTVTMATVQLLRYYCLSALTGSGYMFFLVDKWNCEFFPEILNFPINKLKCNNQCPQYTVA